MVTLPDAVQQEPSCGACGSDTRAVDSDWYECEDCCLFFDATTLAASFANPDREPCGSPCDNTWHGDHMIKQGMGFDCGTCKLPASHTSHFHWTGCQEKQLPIGLVAS